MKIIDISEFNGKIIFDQVVKACDGAVIRGGYRGYGSGKLIEDKYFIKNITGALNVGLPVGVYFVTQAINEHEAREEANYVHELLTEYHLSLPVFIDSENGNNGRGRADHGKLTKTERTRIMLTFCKVVEQLGHDSGIYASESWFKDDLILSELTNVKKWVAKYSKKEPSFKYYAWQYTSQGTISGIKGNVDISKFEIKKEPTKSNEEIAQEVINGLWGNGLERKEKLIKAGYDYNKIQIIVNKLTAKKLKKTKVYYEVKAGDTISGISKRFGVTIKNLVNLNKIKDPDKIYVGQKLRIK